LGFNTQELHQLLGIEDEAQPQALTENSAAGIQYQEKFAVLIDCKNEQEQAKTYEKLTAMGYACKVLVN
jgi:hypothetical protein